MSLRAMVGRLRLFHRTLRHLGKVRRAGAAVEFALCGMAFFGFIMAIVNLGLLGFSLGALARSVQATGRWAAVTASSSYTGSQITLPCLSSDVTAFNRFADPALPALAQTSGTASSTGSQTTGNLTLSATWTGTAGASPGEFVQLTGTYKWVPLGFAPFGAGFPLRITTAATVMGSSLPSVTVSASCS
jgi:hypothetical protein